MTGERRSKDQQIQSIGELSPGWNYGGFDNRSSPMVQSMLRVAASRTLNELTEEEIRLLKEGGYEQKVPIRNKFFDNFSQILNGDES